MGSEACLESSSRIWNSSRVCYRQQCVTDESRATVLESHPNGASVLLGDESGRLTAIAWDFEKDHGILSGNLSGSVHVQTVDLGTVRIK